MRLHVALFFPTLNLIVDDDPQGPAFHGLFVLDAADISIIVSCRDAASVVHRVSADLRRHGVLKRQTDELNAVLSTQTFFHQLSHPPDDGAFTYIQQWLPSTLVDIALLLLKPLHFQLSYEMFASEGL